MIDKKFATEQAKRFSGLDKFPYEIAGFNEIVRSLQVGSTEAIIRVFVEDWLHYQQACPKPAQIRTAMHEANTAVRGVLAQCVECQGTGMIIVDGVNPFDGERTTGGAPCPCRHYGQPILRESDCRRCQGHGIYGGEMDGQYAGPWKWCDCIAGQDRKAKEPGIIAEANQAREKILRRFQVKPISSIVSQMAKDMRDEMDKGAYHGEF